MFALQRATRDDWSILPEVWVVAITGILGQSYSLPVMCSLLPLVGGAAEALSLDS